MVTTASFHSYKLLSPSCYPHVNNKSIICLAAGSYSSCGWVIVLWESLCVIGILWFAWLQYWSCSSHGAFWGVLCGHDKGNCPTLPSGYYIAHCHAHRKKQGMISNHLCSEGSTTGDFTMWADVLFNCFTLYLQGSVTTDEPMYTFNFAISKNSLIYHSHSHVIL